MVDYEKAADLIRELDIPELRVSVGVRHGYPDGRRGRSPMKETRPASEGKGPIALYWAHTYLGHLDKDGYWYFSPAPVRFLIYGPEAMDAIKAAYDVVREAEEKEINRVKDESFAEGNFGGRQRR